MGTRVKICGITNLDDALWAVESGADALGFIFYGKSSRFISISQAAEIIQQLPPFAARVGVFVDAEIELIRQTIREAGINHVQLHGDEPPGFGDELNVPLIKAFRVANRESLARLAEYRPAAFLLDSYTPGHHGGTGEKFNWDLALEAASAGRPIILAGGLTPENVAEAVTRTKPYAVDVASGVEISPGKKDRLKVQAFIKSAKGAC